LLACHAGYLTERLFIWKPLIGGCPCLRAAAMVRLMRLILSLPLLLLSACATFPALEGTISDPARQAPYPSLTPLPPFPMATGDDGAALQLRVDALQARAARIRLIDIAALQ